MCTKKSEREDEKRNKTHVISDGVRFRSDERSGD